VTHCTCIHVFLLQAGLWVVQVRSLCGVLQGYLREAKCHLAMGEIATAIIAYSKVLQLEPQNSSAKTEVKYILCHYSIKLVCHCIL